MAQSRQSKPGPNRNERWQIRYLFYAALLAFIAITSYAIVLYSAGEISETLAESSTSIAFSLAFPAIAFSYLLYKGNSLRNIISQLGLSRKSMTRHAVLVGLALFLAVVMFEFLLGWYSSATNTPLPTNVGNVLGGMPIYFLLFSIFIAPFDEEILFRGFLVPRIGIILSAILFAVLHAGYMSISEFAGALFFGLLAGYVFRRTKSLYPSVIAHILVNLFAVLAFIYS